MGIREGGPKQGDSKLYLLLKMREEEEYVSTKVDGLFVMLPKTLLFTFYIGAYTLISDGLGGLVSEYSDADFEPVTQGGTCWWYAFHPYVLIPKGVGATVFIVEKGRRWRITSYADPKVEAVCEEVCSDWNTVTGVKKDEATWSWVKK